MPSLVMRAPLGSLLEQTNRLIVRRQIDYGAEPRRAVGHLRIRLQRARHGAHLPVLQLRRAGPRPQARPRRERRHRALRHGARRHGRSARRRARTSRGWPRSAGAAATASTRRSTSRRPRLPEGRPGAVVRAYMAHHQGMTIVAHRQRAARRRDAHALPRRADDPGDRAAAAGAHAARRCRRPSARRGSRRQRHGGRPRAAASCAACTTRTRPRPQTHLLSNGRYSVMLTAAGSGYSRWGEHAVTRWREDATRDDWGSYIFLRDVDSGAVWSAGYQPRGAEPDSYDVMLHRGPRRVRAARRRRSPRTLEVVVSPEDDAEVRRAVDRQHRAARARDIELTSYAELVLAPPAADAAHPAFSKLFVQTEFLPRRGAHPGDAPAPRARRTRAVGGASRGGRGRGGRRARDRDRSRALPRPRPRASRDADRGDGRTAPLQHRRHRARSDLRAAPSRADPAGRHGAHRLLDLVAASRATTCWMLVDKHHDTNAFERAATLAWTQAQVQLRHLGIDAAQANLFQRLAGHVLYADPGAASSSDTIRRGGGGRRPLGRRASRRRADRAGAHRRGRGSRHRAASCCRPTSTGG